MAENPFKDIEPTNKAPETLKKSIVSEIDTIRNTSIVIELFIGNFVNTITSALSNSTGTYQDKN
ncbi:hypothetical protein [Flectobacillus major]|uniref:hypothetical protein n=1 Tax=Flectobacillus major TaxID=103 RepID=UPI00041E9620|nr:hypothetical protein [Flectobacillus major]